jgi:acylphosphatase
MKKEQTSKAYKIKVRGLVTGVGFRYSALIKSHEFSSISGYVRNSGSGEVEAFIQGNPDEVEKMLGWFRVGPRFCRIDEIEIEEATPNKNISSFEIVE